MLKKNKIIFSSLCCSIGIGTIIAASILPIVLKQQSSNNFEINSRINEEDWLKKVPFEFKGKQYLDLNDAYDDLLTEINGINSKQFIGNINNKNEDGSIILDNNPIQPYNLNKMFTAYMDANGRYTHDYDKAINSFVNQATLVNRYYDYKGNYFISEKDALDSMRNFSSMGLAYYNVLDVNGNNIKINPLNSQDIKQFKKIAYDWLLSENKTNNPFKIKIVGPDQTKTYSNLDSNTITYSKANEINEQIASEWSTFTNAFKSQLYFILQNMIINVLKNNPIIKTEIYIKPYILKFGPQEQQKDTVSFIPSNTSATRFLWHFGKGEYRVNHKSEVRWNEKKLSISTKNLNLDDFNELAKIFTNIDEFTKCYSLDWAYLNPAGFTPKFQFANIMDSTKNTKLEKYFSKEETKYGIGFDLIKPYVNSLSNVQNYTVNRILTSSDGYGGDIGPAYENNYMLTFGLRPHIDQNNMDIKIGSWNTTYNNSNNAKTIKFSDFIDCFDTQKNGNNPLIMKF